MLEAPLSPQEAGHRGSWHYREQSDRLTMGSTLLYRDTRQSSPATSMPSCFQEMETSILPICSKVDERINMYCFSFHTISFVVSSRRKK